jgi:hypothetical protein
MHPGEGAAIGGKSRNENIRMTSQVGDPFALGLWSKCKKTVPTNFHNALTRIIQFLCTLTESANQSS